MKPSAHVKTVYLVIVLIAVLALQCAKYKQGSAHLLGKSADSQRNTTGFNTTLSLIRVY